MSDGGIVMEKKTSIRIYHIVFPYFYNPLLSITVAYSNVL